MTALHKGNVTKIQILKFLAIFQKVPLFERQYFELTGRAVFLAHKSLVWLSKQSFNIEPCVQTKEKIYLFAVQLLETSCRPDELSEHQWDAVQHTKAEGLNQQIMSSRPASNSWIWDNLPAESLCSLPSDFFICIQLCLSPLKCLKRLIGLVHYQEYPTLVKNSSQTLERWREAQILLCFPSAPAKEHRTDPPSSPDLNSLPIPPETLSIRALPSMV